MMKTSGILGKVVLWCCLAVLAGCSSPVTWQKPGNVDLSKGGKVAVTASCTVPESEIDFLKTKTQENVDKVLTGNADAPDAYQIDIVITKYDEGNAFARAMLIGLGQMHLNGTIEIKEGEPSTVLCSGNLKKDYCVGGLIGGSATMRSSVLSPTGKAIAKAIEAKRVKK